MTMRTTSIALAAALLGGCSARNQSTARAEPRAVVASPPPAASNASGRDATAGPADAAVGLSALVGSWRVNAVQVVPGSVQAITPDDPAYMGAVLTIAPDRLAWRPHAGGTLSDICEGPTLDAARVVHCHSGAFGPEGAVLNAAGGCLFLFWYDNAILVLRRAGG